MWAMWRMLSQPFRGSSPGATTVEYLVVTGLISFVAVAGFNHYGKSIHQEMKNEARYIEGDGLPKAADILGDLGGIPGAVCNIGEVCAKDSNLCFAAGTLVSTEDGDRPIETLEVGERVWSRDEQTGRVELRPIVQTIVTHGQAVIDLEVGGPRSESEHLSVTPSHPFWAEGKGWVAAAELSADALWSPSGALVATPLATNPGLTTVYNLEVAEFHTYFVGRSHAWVHNACKPTTPTTPLEDCLNTKTDSGAQIRNTPNGTAVCNDYVNRLAACGQSQLCKQVQLTIAKCAAEGNNRQGCNNKIWGQVGEDLGAKKARQDGLDTITSKDWPKINPMKNNGFDDVRIDANGNVYIVEYKGNTAGLSSGQMEQQWVNDKLTEIEDWMDANPNGDDFDKVKEVYDKIKAAQAAGKLYGVLYKTTPDPNQPNTDTVATKGWKYTKNGSGAATSTNCKALGASSPPCP